MRELSPAQPENAINKKPAMDRDESFVGSLRQHAVDAWQEIGNLSRQQQRQMNGAQNQNSDSLTFDLIYRDDDSITRCRGYSGPKGDKLSCTTKDLPDKNDKPLNDKYDQSLPDKNDKPLRRGDNEPVRNHETSSVKNTQVPNNRSDAGSTANTGRGNVKQLEGAAVIINEHQRTR